MGFTPMKIYSLCSITSFIERTSLFLIFWCKFYVLDFVLLFNNRNELVKSFIDKAKAEPIFPVPIKPIFIFFSIYD